MVSAVRREVAQLPPPIPVRPVFLPGEYVYVRLRVEEDCGDAIRLQRTWPKLSLSVSSWYNPEEIMLAPESG